MPDIASFYQQYQMPIIEEVMASLRDALEKVPKKNSYPIEMEYGDFVQFSNRDNVTIVTLKHKAEKRVDCSKEIGGFRFIVVKLMMGTRSLLGILDIYEKESKISFGGNFKAYLDRDRAVFHLVPLVSLINLDRMYTVCTTMPDSRLLTQISKGIATPWPNAGASAAGAGAGAGIISIETELALNPSQANAIEPFTHADEGVYLMQGPPGTGKTTTLVCLLEALMKTPQRILVCAPSNAAVQILAERTLEKIPDMPMVLVGVESKIPLKLQPIAFDNWKSRYPDQLYRLVQEYFQVSSVDALKAKVEARMECAKQVRMLETKAQQILEIASVCLRYVPSTYSKEAFLAEIQSALSNYLTPLKDLASKSISSAEAFPTLKESMHRSHKPEPLKSIPIDMPTLFGQLSHACEVLSKSLEKLYHLVKLPQQLLQTAHIVFCTLSTAGRPSLINLCNRYCDPFDVLLIDEAGQTVEAESLIAFHLAYAARKALLVGDTRQLPATTISPRSKENHFDQSMMWRLLEQNKQPFHRLMIQYRMRHAIQHFPNARYYEGSLETHPTVHDRACHSQHFVPKAGYKVWLDSPGPEERFDKSYQNRDEALAIVEQIIAIRQYDRHSSIGVISFYSAQVTLINQLLKHRASSNSQIEIEKIKVSSVDGFQGGERDIIIVSFVRSNHSGSIGFLGDFRRLNVAITRAKDALILCGSVSTFRKAESSEVQELLRYCS